MNIIGKSKIFISISVILVLISWGAIAFLGLDFGIDLVGGTEWQVNFLEKEINTGRVSTFLSSEFNVESSVKSLSTGDIIIRLPDISEEKHETLKESLISEFGELEEKSFSSVGPAVGRELRKKALWAIVGVLFGIALFIAWAFRKVSRPINSWKYGITALIALLHDVSIPVGMLAFLGYYKGIEIDTIFIVALLVVVGLSVNDTVVIMDRIRENLEINRGKKINLEEIINNSVNETIIRSINTSLTLIVVLVSLIFLGPPSIFYFVLTVLVGTFFGTYSSIFLASPILYLWGKEN